MDSDDRTTDPGPSGVELRGGLADGPVRGRGAGINPTNRFESLSLHVLGDHLDKVLEERVDSPTSGAGGGQQVVTHVYRDHTRTLLNFVDSPDLGQMWTLNPYRGCEHGCIYCFARPGHEYLAMSSGLDFETKIMAKLDAPNILRKELAHPKWKAEPVMMSGVTDCYQPIESKLKLTRACVQIMAECRQPVTFVTKSRLILRDLDLLTELHKYNAVRVAVSLTTLDNQLAHKMEPRAASPKDRLWTMQRLASAGIPVTVMAAPMIPALNDREMPAILKAAADAGATSAGYVLLRLPWQIKDLFDDWLTRHFPDRKDHVQNLLRSTHKGELYDATFGKRMKGEGPYAEQLAQQFKVFTHKYGLNTDRRTPLNSADFKPPVVDGQMGLFG